MEEPATRIVACTGLGAKASKYKLSTPLSLARFERKTINRVRVTSDIFLVTIRVTGLAGKEHQAPDSKSYHGTPS
jgi:hypothetical protein